VILEAPDKDEGVISVTVSSSVEEALGLIEPEVVRTDGKHYELKPEEPTVPVFTKPAEKEAARTVMDVIRELETRRDLVPGSSALSKPEVQQAIIEQVKERLTPVQGELLETESVDLDDVVARTTEVVVQKTIDIPRIAVVPTGEVTVGFEPFTLDMSGLHLQPADRELVIQSLRTNEQETLASEVGITEKRLEDYIVYALVDFDDIDYQSQADLLYDLAGQAVQHFLDYLSEDEARAVLDHNRRLIADNIHAQMMDHFWEKASGYEVQVSRGFTQLKPCTYTASEKNPVRNVRETLDDKGRIKQVLFGGFKKCLYPLQKFHSDSERRFAVILERDAEKWFRPVKGQFQIYYKYGTEQPEYVPDFVAESADAIYMVETKARTDMKDDEVQAKADAAAQWCGHASDYASKNGGKAWAYPLIPHDEINESRTLKDFERFLIKQ
jgi:type III restriction enzyme